MVMFPLEVLPVLLAHVLDSLLEDLLGLLGVAGLLERPGPVDVELGASRANPALVHELEDLDGVVSGVGVLGPHIHEAPVLCIPRVVLQLLNALLQQRLKIALAAARLLHPYDVFVPDGERVLARVTPQCRLKRAATKNRRCELKRGRVGHNSQDTFVQIV